MDMPIVSASILNYDNNDAPLVMIVSQSLAGATSPVIAWTAAAVLGRREASVDDRWCRRRHALMP
jgi:hypothetical protein